MKIIINHSSMVPIYEQIVNQIRNQIVNHELKENDSLPSVRSLAHQLKFSALTVKKAYDYLEEEGFIQTIHGKGSFVKCINPSLLEEEIRKNIQMELETTLLKALQNGLTKEEIKELISILLEE